MTKSLAGAYTKVVQSLFCKKSDAAKRRELLVKGDEDSAAPEREAAYAIVRQAIKNKTPPPPGDWVTADEAAVYIGEGGSPRTLAIARSRNELIGESLTIKRNSKLPGLAGQGRGRSVRYRLTDLEQWKKKTDAAKAGTAVAATSPSKNFDRLDEGIRITTVGDLLKALPWLVQDNRLISPLLITRYSPMKLKQFFAAGAEVAWFSLHDAMTKWVWISNEDRQPWSDGYRKILDGAENESRRYDEWTLASASAESLKKQLRSSVKTPGPRIHLRRSM